MPDCGAAFLLGYAARRGGRDRAAATTEGKHCRPETETRRKETPKRKLTTTNVAISRGKLLIGGACMAAAASLPGVTMAATAKQENISASSKQSSCVQP